MKILLGADVICQFFEDPENIYIEKFLTYLKKIKAEIFVFSLNRDKIVKSKFDLLSDITKDFSFKKYEILIKNAEEKNKYNSILINSLLKGKFDIIITEDRNIVESNKKNIFNFVFTVDDFFNKVTITYPKLADYKVLSVQKKYFKEIKLSDEFFSSFKEDYDEFGVWFKKKFNEISYVCYADDKIGAFLYLKVEGIDEDYSTIFPCFSNKKRLKVGTFKVALTGYKIGERFLKIIFDNAIANQVDEIYLTIFNKREEQKRLIRLLEDWGFKIWGESKTKNGVEKVLVRNFSKVENNNSPKFTYPFVSMKNNQIFLVPIYPKYHTDLLPDSILNNESPKNFVENKPHRNAIQKVYISRSVNRNIKRGDLMLFYRTGGYYKGVISTLGIVESINDNINCKVS